MTKTAPGRTLEKVLLALAVLASAWIFWQGQRLLRADLASARARVAIIKWVSGSTQPRDAAEWAAARDDLTTALAITPDDPELSDRLGDLYTVAGRRDWNDEALRRQHFRQAVEHYRRATALRPNESTAWGMQALAGQVTGETASEVQSAWSRALALGPFEGNVQPVLMQVVLSDWSGASPAMQAWANRLFDDSDVATRRDINALAARYGLVFQTD